jgi:hypothetical protein
MNDWHVWSPKSHPLNFEPRVLRRISLVTTCMGRADDLKKTLVKNIEDNIDYPNIEFVILNYNSPDSMHDFMTSPEILPLIKAGKIRYLITGQPRYYSFSHSRNVAALNSTGDIFINVDADNFTGQGFAAFINLLAEIQPQKAVFSRGKRRIHGRIGMYMNEFRQLGGYDEELVGYGFDDQSLLLRAIAYGCKLMWWKRISPEEFAKRIVTSRQDVSRYLKDENWRATEWSNKRLTLEKVSRNEFHVNVGRRWGCVDDLVVYGVS